jgi:hypothetical protein
VVCAFRCKPRLAGEIPNGYLDRDTAVTRGSTIGNSLPVYRKLIWTFLLAFTVRVAVRGTWEVNIFCHDRVLDAQRGTTTSMRVSFFRRPHYREGSLGEEHGSEKRDPAPRRGAPSGSSVLCNAGAQYISIDVALPSNCFCSV